MSRAFTLDLKVNADLAYQDQFGIEDGDDVRFHDVVVVLERLLYNVRARGSDRVPTRSQVAAQQARVDAANRVLADWTRTADAVNTTIVLGGDTTYSCTWVKKGNTEYVEAPCTGRGEANFETAAVLEKWEAPSKMAEA